jgi:hypothetical protein
MNMEGYEMTAIDQKKVYVQQHWTNQALEADGFHAYPSVKRLTMVRLLPVYEAPKTIESDGETLTAEAGYWIAYVAGEVLKNTLDDYDPRPIDPDVFADTYRAWDEASVPLTLTQAHLQQLGCQPYYKFASVWAKNLSTDTWIQGMESDEPVLTPAGAWLLIGTDGEPWSVTDTWFQTHYVLQM